MDEVWDQGGYELVNEVKEVDNEIVNEVWEPDDEPVQWMKYEIRVVMNERILLRSALFAERNLLSGIQLAAGEASHKKMHYIHI